MRYREALTSPQPEEACYPNSRIPKLKRGRVRLVRLKGREEQVAGWVVGWLQITQQEQATGQ